MAKIEKTLETATEGWSEQLKGSASTLLDKAQEKATDVANRAQDIASQTTENAETIIRRYPLRSLAVGFGVGVLVGLLMPSRR